jgi:hypothetical protein
MCSANKSVTILKSHLSFLDLPEVRVPECIAGNSKGEADGSRDCQPLLSLREYHLVWLQRTSVCCTQQQCVRVCIPLGPGKGR